MHQPAAERGAAQIGDSHPNNGEAMRGGAHRAML